MKNLGLAILMLLALAGCGSDDNSKNYDIYAVGYNKPHSETAAYWKNGEEFPLDDGGHTTYVNGIVAEGDDVYIFGEQYPGVHAVATYWKNGTRIQLSDGARDEGIWDLVISGSDVYASGYERSDNGGWKPKYWKNSTATLLPGAVGFSPAVGIAVAGNDVHVIGWDSAPDTVIARYWKNGQLVSILPKLKYSIFTGITVEGSDVYIAGYNSSATHPFSSGIMKTAYWKNGAEVALGFGQTSNIEVSGSDVYVAGTGDDNYEAGYWLNQTYHSIRKGENNSNLGVSFVALAGGDVLVSALHLENSNERHGTFLWRNDELLSPFTGDNVNIEVREIAVGN